MLSKPLFANKAQVLAVSLLAVVVVFYLDWLTGPDFSFSLFYFFPIFLAVWYGGFGYGLAVIVVATALRATFDIQWATDKRPFYVLVWRLTSRALIQSLFAYLITGLRRTLDRANRARAEAEAATQSKSRFLAAMSHDLRTPMNAILAMAELLDRSSLNPDQKSWVKVFRREGKVLLNQLNDLLDFSKIEARQYRLDNRGYSLPGLLEEVQSVLGVQAREKGLNLRIRSDPALPARIWGDAGGLRRVLFNLIGNAVKFTARGEVSVEVAPARAGGKDELVLTVTDSGAGIPADQLEAVFAPFVQVDSAAQGSVGGTGLGLTIVRELVTLMGGTVRVESRLGEGSQFVVNLPLVAADGEVSVGALPAAETDPSWRPSADLEILVADDYPTNRLILREYLRGLPCRITEVENGEQAVDAVRSKTFSLVLMDVKMPVLDGYEAVRAIRTWEAAQHRDGVPILALTAHAYAEDVDKALAAGFQAHLSKPLERAQVLQAIQRWAHVAPEAEAPAPEFAEWTQRYLAEVEGFRLQAASAWASGDLKALETIGHRLRGSGSVFGRPDLSDLGAELEEACLAGDRVRVAAVVERFKRGNTEQEVAP